MAEATWFPCSTLDLAVSQVGSASRYADRLRRVIGASRRHGWARAAAAYTAALDTHVEVWRRLFADETQQWDQVRGTFEDDLEILRQHRRKVLAELAQTSPRQRRAAAEAAAAVAAKPHTEPEPQEPAAQVDVDEPVSQPENAPTVEAGPPSAAKLKAVRAEEHQPPKREILDEDQDDETEPAVSLWSEGTKTVEREQRQHQEDAELKTTEHEPSSEAEPPEPIELPLLPPPLPPIAAYAPTSPKPKRTPPYRVEDVPRPEYRRAEGSRVRLAVMATFVVAAVAGAGYVAVAASGSTKSAAAAPRTTPRPSTTAPTTPSALLSTPAPSTSSTAPSVSPVSAPKPPPPAKTTVSRPPAPSTTAPAPTSQRPPQPTTTTPPPPPHSTTTRPPSSPSVTGVSVSVAIDSGGSSGTAYVHVTTTTTGTVTLRVTIAGSSTYDEAGSTGPETQTLTLSGSRSYNEAISFDALSRCNTVPYVGALAAAGGVTGYGQASAPC